MHIPPIRHSRKLLAAIPAVVGASQATAAVHYTDLGDGVTGFDLYFNFVEGTAASGSITTPQFYMLTKSLLYLGYSDATTSQIATNGSYDAIVFEHGDLIGDTSAFQVSAFTGPLTAPVYLGFKFEQEGDTLYGWALFNMVDEYTGRLYGFAYDDTGAAIAAGATSAVPEPASAATIAGLLGGAAALAARRKRKASVMANAA